MTADAPDAGGTDPGGEIRIEGDEDARTLLAPTLTWAAGSIDIRFGACALLSGRLEPISRASGRASGSSGPGPSSEARLREVILATPQVVVLAKRLEGDPTLPTVFEPDRADLSGGLIALLDAAGLSMPHALALRSRGRLTGMLLLCRAVSSDLGSGAVTAALRRVQPLVEIAVDPDAAAARLPPAADVPGTRDLTPRERSVVELVVSGAGNVEIATELGIAKTTVRNHISRILRKFGVRTRAQLIAIYLASEESGGNEAGPFA